GNINADQNTKCDKCGMPLAEIPTNSANNTNANGNPPPANNFKQPMCNNHQPIYPPPINQINNNMLPPPPQFNNFMPPQPFFPPKKAFSWNDICTLIGFISSIVGVFCCSIILLPIAIICSLLGFKGNRTRSLAVAGVVISAIAVILRICIILYENDLIPQWITNGIFNI
ncbi:MAG: DUF4190 domain-containing protein, partial [Oscillospiraceae bacterium]